MIVKHRINMDMAHIKMPQMIDVMLEDRYSREIDITLKNNMQDFVLPKDCTVMVCYRHTNGVCGAYDTLPNGETAWRIAGNVVTIGLAPQVCAAPGVVTLTVVLTHEESELSCFEIGLEVHGDVKPKGKRDSYVNITRFVPQPENPELGKYLKVAEIDSMGRISGLETADEVAHDGKTAYAYAQEGGYTGTEEEFAKKLAQEIPTELPSPYELTINGKPAYDGSKEIDIELDAQDVGAVDADYVDRVIQEKIPQVPTKVSQLENDSDYAPREELPKVFYVTLNTGTMTVDKTHAEINAAYTAGRPIFCIFPSMVGSVLVNTLCPLVMKLPYDAGWSFSLVGLIAGQSNANAGYINVLVNGSVNYNMVTLANVADIPAMPTTLPNPNALIINGTTYNGSSTVDMTEAVNAMIDAKLNAITNAEEVSF